MTKLSIETSIFVQQLSKWVEEIGKGIYHLTFYIDSTYLFTPWLTVTPSHSPSESSGEEDGIDLITNNLPELYEWLIELKEGKVKKYLTEHLFRVCMTGYSSSYKPSYEPRVITSEKPGPRKFMRVCMAKNGRE